MTDNLLYTACQRAKLVRIKLTRDMLLCENFVSLDDDDNICFKNVYSFMTTKTYHNICVNVDDIVDIEFSF